MARAFVRLGFAGKDSAALFYIAKSARFEGAGEFHLHGGVYVDDRVVIITDSRVSLEDGVRLNVGALVTAHGEHGDIRIGKSAYIRPYCVINAVASLAIGSNALIGPNCGIFAESHGTQRGRPFNEQPITGTGIRIGENVWIGAGSTILDGVEIGNNSVVGAGAVVTKSFPPHSLIAGVPARLISVL